MTTSLRILPALPAVAAGLVAIATPAAARDARVVYSDLDLATASGRAELDKRIDRAATAACSVEPATGTRIRTTSAVRKCIADAKKEIGTRIAERTSDGKLGG